MLTSIRYNTAVFSTLSANSYIYIVVNEDFFAPSAIYNASSDWASLSVLNTMHELGVQGSLANYTSTKCMDTYGVNFVSTARNVLLVTRDTNTSNNTVLNSDYWGSYYQIPYWWICGDAWDANPYTDKTAVCTPSIAKAAASDWTVHNHHISYCMVELVEEQCRLSFSFFIMLVVIGVNASKACISTYYSLDLSLHLDTKNHTLTQVRHFFGQMSDAEVELGITNL
jgi:hypothetical protein